MEKLNMPVANLATGIYTEDSLKLILDQYVILGEEIGFNITLDRSSTGMYLESDKLYILGGNTTIYDKYSASSYETMNYYKANVLFDMKTVPPLMNKSF